LLQAVHAELEEKMLVVLLGNEQIRVPAILGAEFMKAMLWRKHKS
jgi:hypothetical protein